MRHVFSKFGVPAGSFALSVVLAWVSGPNRPAFSFRMAAESTGSCSTKISGPDIICQESTATYTATGTPGGGTFNWSISGDDGATIDSSSGNTCTVKTTKDPKTFTLHMTYVIDASRFCTDAKKVSCNPFVVVPICARRLRDSTGTKGTAMTDADVQAAVDHANEFWKKCCIRFELEKDAQGKPVIDEVNTPPKDDGLATQIEVHLNGNGGATSSDFGKVKKLDHHNKCINVYFVKSMTNVQGLTTRPQYPGDTTKPPTGLNQAGTAVMDGASQSTLAHELGHELGLKDVNNPKNLMNGGGPDGSDLTDSQCATAYQNAKRLLDAFNQQ